jgi:hypothetical protein
VAARDDIADGHDRVGRDHPLRDGVLRLADGDRLRDLVGKDAGAGQQRRLDLLLALGVGAHAGQMRARAEMGIHQARREGRGDGDDRIRLGAKRGQIDGLERQAELGRDGAEARQHLGVIVPGHHPLEPAHARGGAQLERRLMPRPHHAEHARILAREQVDRERRGRGRAQRRQQIAPDQRRGPARVGVEEDHDGLMVRQAFGHVSGPVAAGLHAEHEVLAIEPRLEAVERIRMPQRLAHDRKVARRAVRHGGEGIAHRGEGIVGAEQVGNEVFRHEIHRAHPSAGSGKGRGARRRRGGLA